MAEALYGGRIADPNLQRQLMRRQMGITDYLLSRKGYTAPSKEDRMKYIADYTGEMQKAAGESPYGGMNEYIQQQLGDLAKEREEGKGIAALEAIPAILQPGGALRGFGAAAASMGGSYAKLAQSQRAAKQSLMQMQFNLKDAERKERMGLHRDARADYASAEQNRIAADKADREAKAAAGNIIAKTMQANRVVGGGAGAGGKEFVVGPSAYEGRIREEHPDWTPARIKAAAFKEYQQGRTPGLPGVLERVESAEQTEKSKQFEAGKLARRRDYHKVKGDPAATAQLDKEIADIVGYRLPPTHPAMQGGGGAKPIYATNGKERIVSTDNGKTWNPVNP
jgi:hypothetical protein